MCRHVSSSIQDDEEDCEQMLMALRERRISIQNGVLDKLVAPAFSRRETDERKRESFDQARLRLLRDHDDVSSMKDGVSVAMEIKGVSRSAETGDHFQQLREEFKLAAESKNSLNDTVDLQLL